MLLKNRNKQINKLKIYKNYKIIQKNLNKIIKINNKKINNYNKIIMI